MRRLLYYQVPASRLGPDRRVWSAASAALFAFSLFPFFHRLRNASGRARLARVARGA